MCHLSNRINPDEVKAGDHGIYVGGNKVIHFTSDQENAKSNSVWNLSSSLPIPSSCLNSSCLNSSCLNSSCLNSACLNSSCLNSACLNSIDGGFSLHNGDSGSCLCTYSCGFHQAESGVTLSCLNCFTGTGSLYLYQYGGSKWMHMSRLRGGICTIEQSDPPQDVIDRAIYLLGQQKGFGDYNMVTNNCEDFALYCKTELMIDGKRDTGGSGQVNFVINALWKPILVQVLKKVVLRTGMSLLEVPVMVGQYSWDRYKHDIGVRGDVIKVEVKDAESFRLSRGY